MMRSRGFTTITWLAVVGACGQGDGPTDRVEPSGPPPGIAVSLGFGGPPLEGFLYLHPTATTEDWGYSIDLNEDDQADHEGIVGRDIGFAYRFESPGVHRIRVDLTGPDGPQTIDAPVVVNDPNAVHILAQRQIVLGGPFLDFSFEGITTDRNGTAVYVADFWQNEIFRLDPSDLQDLGPSLKRPRDRGFEALSVPPSDTLLFVMHKDFGMTVIAIPSMEFRRNIPVEGDFFAHAIDDTLALTTGWGHFSLIDTRSGSHIRALPIPAAWHFSVSPNGSMAAVLNVARPAAVHLVGLLDLQEIDRIDFPNLFSVSTVAFDPAGDRLYVMGSDGQDAHFLLVEVASRTVLLTLPLGPGRCGYCVANPVATLPSGRFVAMEWGGGTYFIDTELDLPRFHTGIRVGNNFFAAGLSVAASPVEEAFYLLRPDGFIQKVRIEE